MSARKVAYFRGFDILDILQFRKGEDTPLTRLKTYVGERGAHLVLMPVKGSREYTLDILTDVELIIAYVRDGRTEGAGDPFSSYIPFLDRSAGQIPTIYTAFRNVSSLHRALYHRMFAEEPHIKRFVSGSITSPEFLNAVDEALR